MQAQGNFLSHHQEEKTPIDSMDPSRMPRRQAMDTSDIEGSQPKSKIRPLGRPPLVARAQG